MLTWNIDHLQSKSGHEEEDFAHRPVQRRLDRHHLRPLALRHTRHCKLAFPLLHDHILTHVSTLQVGPTGPSKSGQWSVRESFVAVLVSNTPMVFPLLKSWSCTVLGIVSSHTKSSAAASGSYPLHDYDKSTGSALKSIGFATVRSGGRKKSKAFQHPLSIPNDTAWGSDEAIVTKDQDGIKSAGSQGTRSQESGLTALPEREEIVGYTASRGNGRLSGGGVGPGEIVMTREWQVRGE